MIGRTINAPVTACLYTRVPCSGSCTEKPSERSTSSSLRYVTSGMFRIPREAGSDFPFARPHLRHRPAVDHLPAADPDTHGLRPLPGPTRRIFLEVALNVKPVRPSSGSVKKDEEHGHSLDSPEVVIPDVQVKGI